jgi:hypothetical protein
LVIESSHTLGGNRVLHAKALGNFSRYRYITDMPV